MPPEKKGKLSYRGMHNWIERKMGTPNKCDNEKNHFKGSNSTWFEWHNISGKYKKDIFDWIRLCRSCHDRLHKGNFCKQGHEFTKENTRWRHVSKRQYSRVCIKCARAINIKYLKNKRRRLNVNSL